MITIYTDLYINSKDNIYYVFSNKDYFTYFLQYAGEWNTIQENNYRLNKEELIVDYDERYDDPQYATYVRWTYENITRYFHILSYEVISKKIIFKLKEDYFAEFNYEFYKNKNNVLFRKTNFECGNNKIRDIEESSTTTSSSIKFATLYNCYILVVISREIQENLFSDKSQQTEIYAFKNQEGSQYIHIEENMISNVIGSIYRWFYGEGLQSYKKCAPIKAYVVPREWISLTEDFNIFNTSESFNEKNALKGYKVNTGLFESYFNVPLTKTDLLSKNIYVGTNLSKIKLQKRISNNFLKIKTLIGKDNINIIMNVNGTEEDISKDFELEMSFYEGQTRTLGNILSLFKSGIDIVKNPLSSIDLLQGIEAKENYYKPTLINGGDFLTNYNANNANILIIEKHSGIPINNYEIDNYGSETFFITNFPMNLPSTYNSVSGTAELDFLYMQADIEVNAPLEIANYIKNLYKEGIKVYSLDDY